jgi:hypothetical protein
MQTTKKDTKEKRGKNKNRISPQESSTSYSKLKKTFQTIPHHHRDSFSKNEANVFKHSTVVRNVSKVGLNLDNIYKPHQAYPL